MTNAELDAINRLNKNEADRFWNAIGSIREPACCSLVNENRFRLADYALRYYVKFFSINIISIVSSIFFC
jgi:hypothetical protein